MTTVGHCQWYMQPLSPAVRRSRTIPSTSVDLLIIMRHYLQCVCVCVCVRVCAVYKPATIRGQRLFKEIQ